MNSQKEPLKDVKSLTGFIDIRSSSDETKLIEIDSNFENSGQQSMKHLNGPRKLTLF